jgi:tetratricopeptide (TPR) repeat protein
MKPLDRRFWTVAALGLSGVSIVPGAALSGGCQSGSRAADAIGPSLDERQTAARQLAMQAQQAEKSRDPARAIDLYQQSARNYDGLPYVWNNLGVLLLRQQRHLEAVEAFQRASQLSPTDPRPLENIGIAYHQRGWDQRALEYFNRALESQPRSITALRGAIQASRRLNIADEPTLERARTGLMLEADPAWIAVYQREVFRIEYQLKRAKQPNATTMGLPPGSSTPKRSEGEADLEPPIVEVPMPTNEPAPAPSPSNPGGGR